VATKKKSVTLDRDQQILSRLARIEHRVDSLDQTQAFALRAEAAKHFETVKAIFKNGKRRAQIYLAADGTKGVEEIARHLGMQRQNVGPDLKIMRSEGILEITDTEGGKDLWGKKPIDQTLRISSFLRTEYGLQPDGRPEKARKSNKSKKQKLKKAR
jgi:hypothetical protein